MADFKTKLFMFAGIATLFAGMANAQYQFTGVSTAGGNIRAEGQTEFLPPQTVTLTQTGPNANGAITLTLTEPVAVSNAVNNSGALTEVTAVVGAPGAGSTTGTITVGGTGNNIVTIPITLAGFPSALNQIVSITISNIRINASAVVGGTVNESVALQGANAFSGGTNSPVPAATVTSGFQKISIPVVTNATPVANAICSSLSNATAQFTVNFTEGFLGAFQTKAGEQGNSAVAATNGTRIAITFGNVPSNVTAYVPLTITATGAAEPNQNNGPPVAVNGILTLINSATATPYVAASAAGNSAPLNGYGAVSGGVAYYELTTAEVTTAPESYSVPVFFALASGSLAAQTSPVTAALSFAPTTALSSNKNYPDFTVGASTTTLNGSTFINCSTTLLFPFVSQGNGLDTGIAIANTSLDTLNNGKSQASNQTGICNLTFFPSASTNAAGVTNSAAIAVATASIPAGGTWLGDMGPGGPNSIAGAAGVNGYMIASCNFLYGHGFGYISYELGTGNGATMGYTADVLPSARAATATAPETVGQ